jgi:hypothetical protein
MRLWEREERRGPALSCTQKDEDRQKQERDRESRVGGHPPEINSSLLS